MKISFAGKLNLAGLLAGLVGVIVLFRYGMPFHVPTSGAVSLISERLDENAIKQEHLYTVLGYVGLALLVIGAFLQVWAVFETERRRVRGSESP